MRSPFNSSTDFITQLLCPNLPAQYFARFESPTILLQFTIYFASSPPLKIRKTRTILKGSFPPPHFNGIALGVCDTWVVTYMYALLCYRKSLRLNSKPSSDYGVKLVGDVTKFVNNCITTPHHTSFSKKFTIHLFSWHPYHAASQFNSCPHDIFRFFIPIGTATFSWLPMKNSNFDPIYILAVFCVGSVIGGFPSFECFVRPFCGQNLGKNG